MAMKFTEAPRGPADPSTLPKAFKAVQLIWPRARSKANSMAALYDIWVKARLQTNEHDKGNRAAQQLALLGNRSLVKYDSAHPDTRSPTSRSGDRL